MEVSKPGPGEDLNDAGTVTEPRQASTVLVLRGGEETLEVLLVQRHPDSRFMGGAWVFPGGALDEADGSGEAGLKQAALRELQEEAGIELPDGHPLVPFSRWITPREIKIRFDTWFYLAELPDGCEPAVDGHECVDLRWVTPAAALKAHQNDELLLVFPTIRSLEQIGRFETASELVAHAQELTVEPIEPRIRIEGEVARVLLPGDDGYDAS
jgi:8-oxo-dGTP pyrophosphatase MutT (NUDIX family)